MTPWLVAFTHLVMLPIGLSSIVARGYFLKRVQTVDDLPPVFAADAAWGLVAIGWIGTGLWRALGGFEKGSAYYAASTFFWVKMGLLILILLLELWPMITLIQWRIAKAKKAPISFTRAITFSNISFVQTGLVLLMVLFATGMARGIGMR